MNKMFPSCACAQKAAAKLRKLIDILHITPLDFLFI